MSKKILISFAPVLAVAAFMVMPAMASAQTPEWYVNGVAVAGPTPVVSSGGPATLEYSGETITCKTVRDGGFLLPPETLGLPEPPLTNKTGQDVDSIDFAECENKNHEGVTVTGPEGAPTVEVLTFLIANGAGEIFNEYIPANGGNTFAEVENPTGSGLKPVTGTGTPVSGLVCWNRLIFNASNLKLAGEEATFKLTIKQEGENGEHVTAKITP